MRWPSISSDPGRSHQSGRLLMVAVWLFLITAQPSFAQLRDTRRSETPQQILNQSLAQLRLRNFELALNGFSEVIRTDDRNALAWFGRAMTRCAAARQKFVDHTATTDEVEALETDCLMALRLNPDVYAAYRRWAGPPADEELKAIHEQIEIIASLEFVRGLSLLASNEFDQAFECFDRAADLVPGDPHLLYTRGFFHQVQGHFDAAISDFDKIVQLHQTDPEAASGHIGLALDARSAAWREKGNYQRALADANEAMRLMPNVGSPVMNRGIAHFRNNNVDQALSDLTEAIRLDPTLALAWYQRGVIFGIREDNARGLNDLNEAIRLDPKHAESHFARGMLLVKDGKSAEALADLTTAIELAPAFPAAWFNRGVLRSDSNDFSGAIEDLTQFINLAAVISISAGELALAHEHRAKAYEQTGKSELAMADRRRSEELRGVSAPDPVDALLRDLNSGDPAARITAARGLRGIADARTVEPLCRRLQTAMETIDRDPLLVFHLQQALIEIQDINAIDVLIAQQQSDSNLVPVVASSLAKFEEPRAVDAIMLQRELGRARQDDTLLRVLEYIIRDRIRGPRAREVLMQRLQQGDVVAVAALRRFPDPEVVRELITALNNSDARVRRTAADSLGAIGNSEAGTALLPLLHDPDPAVRRHTARALGDLQEPLAVAPLLELWGRESEEKVLAEVAYALGRLGNQAALGPLQDKATGTESAWLRRKIDAAILSLRQ